jgi:hypothetical protein
MTTAETQSWIEDEIETILATTARLLVRGQQVTAASILANAEISVRHWSHDNWNGGQDTWRVDFAVAPEVYYDLEDRQAIEATITRALAPVMEAVSERDSLDAYISTTLQPDPDWRQKVRQHLTGEGITNQGRVRSDNIAARVYDGLLFRSRSEVLFYDALKRTGVPFAPLSVVLRGGHDYRRIEPDFVIFKDGIVMVVEIDGDLYHMETPAAAHTRLKMLLDEGVRLERITAAACDTPGKAAEAVALVLSTIDKLQRQ